MVDLGLVVGVFFASVVPIVLLFLVVRGRGDIIRLWSSNVVPYFRRMRWNRPLRLKVRPEMAQTLNADIVSLIDHAIFLVDTAGKIDVDHKKDDSVSDALFKSWKEIRQHPEHYSLWGTYTKKSWVHEGVKGRWVYLYHLFPLEEMTKRLGRHRMIQGVLLTPPISLHMPLTKEQWLEQHRKEMTSDKKVKKLEKEYRKKSKDKWLNLFFHPTVTVTSEAQMLERLQGFGNLVAINAYVMREMGEKHAKYEYMASFTESMLARDEKVRHEFHNLASELGEESTLNLMMQRGVAKVSTPTHLSPPEPPVPLLPSQEAKPVEKPSKLKVPLSSEHLNIILFALGLLMVVLGGFASAYSIVAIGAVLMVAGAFMFWREGKRFKLPESVKETVAEKQESIAEEGA